MVVEKYHQIIQQLILEKAKTSLENLPLIKF